MLKNKDGAAEEYIPASINYILRKPYKDSVQQFFQMGNLFSL